VIGELDATGAVVGLTADHGMNAKVGVIGANLVFHNSFDSGVPSHVHHNKPRLAQTREDGSPKVHFLESILTALGINSRVVRACFCPSS